MKRIYKEIEGIMKARCPDDTYCDYKTRKVDKDGNCTGCRGLTCLECWNVEVDL